MKLTLNENYIDDVSRVGAEDYDGAPIWRIVGLVEDGGRIQMYVLGLGAHADDDSDDKDNYFEPSVRAARYTTEESLIFKTEHSANKFLNAFKKNYSDTTEFKLREFHAAEYHPVNEITKLIPVHTPIGDAYCCLQKVVKKSYED